MSDQEEFLFPGKVTNDNPRDCPDHVTEKCLDCDVWICSNHYFGDHTSCHTATAKSSPNACGDKVLMIESGPRLKRVYCCGRQ